MNKTFRTIGCIAVMAIVTLSCSSKDPAKKGMEAGKAACECYNLEDGEAVENCIQNIEKEYAELLNDTAFTNAMEQQLLDCIFDKE